jgi:hypothetical protein
MYLRIDQFGSKEAIIKHLMVAKYTLSHKAAQVCDEAQEYFLPDSKSLRMRGETSMRRKWRR